MKTAVITTGGLGTRLLTCTKSNPKSMLPLYERSDDKNTDPLLRPLVEIIFENLYDQGFRKFCFIVNTKTKFAILHHLIPDYAYINLLKKRNTSDDRRFIQTLRRLYKKINNCKIEWVPQATPMGFGHALLSARKFVGNDTFLLHTGDAYFQNYEFLSKLVKTHKKTKNVVGTLLLQHKKQLKGYGVAQIKRQNNEYVVFHVEEKPKKPLSNLAILPVYIFEPIIFEALKQTPTGHNCELQVTDAIKTLIDWDKKIMGFKFGNRPWFDIGTPINYFMALKHSYKKSTS
jgi:UTP--glucose-1-phosphate uridylyltransferase